MKLAWGIALSFLVIPSVLLALPDWQPQVFEDAAWVYGPIAEEEHLTLHFTELLNESSLVASAESDGVDASVNVYGGMLSSSRLSPDVLRITICHELGHIFGGAVRRHVPPEWEGAVAEDGLSIMSAEGEADYYATLVCFRKMIAGQDHQAVLAGRNIPAVTISKCENSWGAGTEEALVCERTALAALDFLNFVMDFPISLERSAPERVAAPLLDEYPTRQCRLDTLVAGALCRSSFPMQLDRNHSAANDCDQVEARRPACWYPQDGLGQ